jgi:uncharacterized membrane protein
MKDRLLYYWNRTRERLWFKPLLVSLLSVGAVFLAHYVDGLDLADDVPEVDAETNETLLSIMASSMLVIATFAVASMVSAYASASNTATPRTFPLVISDDDSQNALSGFIGAFIYSIVALVAVKDGYFGKSGQFVLFALTMLVFAWVVFVFVRWVDRIARLGRLGNVIEKVEAAAAASLDRRRDCPTLRGRELEGEASGASVYSEHVGYVHRVDVKALQEIAEKAGSQIALTALPGTFVTPDRALLCVSGGGEIDRDALRAAFRIGDKRVYDEDPRFGLIVLSEIAARALSPAVNDPGTAINIIGAFVRLFQRWIEPPHPNDEPALYERVNVPRISVGDMFDDAFVAIARDGAGMIEVQVRLQKAFRALAAMDDAALELAAVAHSKAALARAEHALHLEEEIDTLRKLALTRAG